jgi:hypothetical protein
MKWFRKLLGKPAAKSAPAEPPRQPPRPAVVPAADIGQLRQALAAAGADSRAGAAKALGAALASVVQEPEPADPAEVWLAAVCHLADKGVAPAWLDRLAGDAALAEVATQARNADIRLEAARRIQDGAVLDQVARASRDKDKRVHRHCADCLRERRLAEQAASRVQELAGRLRALLAEVPLSQSRLIALDREVRGLGGEAGECAALLEQARVRSQQEADQRRQAHAGRAGATALQAECAATDWPEPGQIETWQQACAALAQARAGLPDWLAGEADATAWSASIVAIEARLSGWIEEAGRVAACDRFLAGLPTDQAPDEAAVAAWADLAKPARAAARSELEARWRARLPAVVVPEPEPEARPAKPPRAPKSPRIDEAALRGLLDQLDAALAEGHLAAADGVVKAIEAMLAGHAALHGHLAARWQAAHARLGELRGWARWGGGQAREHLITAAEALLGGDPDVDRLAVAVPELREEWKRLNASAPAREEQWRRFDAALERAWQPVEARRAEEAARHDAARSAKEAMCADWEAWLAAMAWEHADYKVIEARRQEILAQWRAAPQASFRDERTLHKRLDALLHTLDGHLDGARAIEIARREQLVSAAEALVDEADLGRAMDAAKALQAQWNQASVPVRLKRDDEQRLWQRFRAGCNAVFARRDALRAEQAAQREAGARARQAMLDALAATLAGNDAGAISHALARFRADWKQARPDPRGPTDGLDARARELEQQVEQRLASFRQARNRARYDAMAAKAALAEAIELAAAAGQPLAERMAEARQAWEELPHLPGKLEALLADRLAAAAETTAATLASGHGARETLLLDLEMALDLPSPDACAEARRLRQMARLQAHFGAAATDLPDPEGLLARWYATPARADPEHELRVAAVVARLAGQG